MYELLEDSDAIIICTDPPLIGEKANFSVQIIAILIVEFLYHLLVYLNVEGS
ncbi:MULTISPECIES: hypothetical protein [Clostridium]|uniref:Uncharacterized protein n=1 Tax=Clostridium frigoriphilum TaxID=443253 RepID=A0ABU7UU26_9CLOT|nr:hypothetical protein [Clostridium sp. DSM 17811]MBU3101650.1 hypothetical protein [Clostridium sp. DSM 17811]